MAIKRKQSATYLSDSGKEFEVDEMSPSHILNVICHHRKQVEGLERCLNLLPDNGLLSKRLSSLDETIMILATELATRDPDKDGEQDTSKQEDRARWKSNDY